MPYNISNWLDKNKDPLNETVVALLEQSKESLVGILFAPAAREFTHNIHLTLSLTNKWSYAKFLAWFNFQSIFIIIIIIIINFQRAQMSLEVTQSTRKVREIGLMLM